MNNRNVHIDVLRFFGISCIVLAHVSAPNCLYQWRTFDVPLMVFISGLVLANKDINSSLREYWIHRCKRLLIPVYLFLFLFFGGTYLVSLLIGMKLPFTTSEIIESFLLMEGIGYVWVIRVFLIIAILAPLFLKIISNIRKNYIFFLLIVILSLLPDFLIRQNIFDLNFIIREYILYAIGYGAIFLVGLKSIFWRAEYKEWDFWGYIGVFILLFILYTGNNNSLPLLSTYKFPPQSLFILYGIIVSQILWLTIRYISFPDGKLKSFMLFIGQNTIWIYLIHIPFVFCFDKHVEQWWLRFLFIYTFAIIVCMLKNKVIDLCLKRYSWVSYLKG